MESKILQAATVLILGLLYVLSPSPLEMFVALLLLTGLTFSAAALSDMIMNDMTWAVIAAGSTYWGLTLIAPGTVGLTAALTVLLILFLVPMSTPVDEWELGGWQPYYPVALAAVAVGGVYLGSYLTPWLVAAPFIELSMDKVSLRGDEGSYRFKGFYYILSYTLALRLNPILIVYVLILTVARRLRPGLGQFKAVPIDSVLRLLVWVASAWIIGL